MKELTRTRQGIFSIGTSYTLEDIAKDNYQILKIQDALPHIQVTKVSDELLKKIQNGMVVDSFFKDKLSLLVDSSGRAIAIYQNTEEGQAKPYKMIEV